MRSTTFGRREGEWTRERVEKRSTEWSESILKLLAEGLIHEELKPIVHEPFSQSANESMSE